MDSSSSKLALIFICVLMLLGCRDIIVNVPSDDSPATAISGLWGGEFGTYDSNWDETTVPEDIRRRDSIRLSIGNTDDNYAVHGVWTISVYSYIEQGFSTASYPFSSSMIDTGSGIYSMRLYVNQGSAIYEMWNEGDALIVRRPDMGYTHSLSRITS
jgi:hypothetical protein